jgi:vancomycin resistance protein YoaR
MARHRLPVRARNIAISIVAFVAVFVAAVAAAYNLDTTGEDRTIRDLVIDGRPAGDLTRSELDRLLSRVSHQVEGSTVTLNFPDRRHDLLAIDLGVTLDTPAMTEAAFRSGEADSTWQRFKNWLGSFTGHRPVPLSLMFDRDRADRVVSNLDGLVVQEATEPELVLDAQLHLTVRPGESGTVVDVNAVVDRLGHQVEAGGPFRVDAPLTDLPPEIDDAVAQQLAEELNEVTAPGITVRVEDEERTLGAVPLRLRLDVTLGEDGTPTVAFDLDSLQRLIEDVFADVTLGGEDPVFEIVDDQPRVVEEGTPPLQCCRDDAAGMVAAALLEEGEHEVTVETQPSEDPRVLEWATGEQVVEKVAEFTTEHPCCQTRVSNIQRFADLVRGVYLVPGESLSLNEHVGERTREKGFVPAGTIIRGHLVPTVGGGVSQFATTLFNAAFFAGFDFLDYQSHSIYFSRYPYGREATISWPAPDLKIQNTTDYPALIWTSYTDTSITVSIYSTRSVEVEQIGQEVSSVRRCTRVDTHRLRTYEDGTEVEDSVFATYRPAEGLDCNGNPTDRPDF